MTQPKTAIRPLAAAALALLAGAVALAEKKPLDHSVYDGWKSIARESISDNGRWVFYVLQPQDGDPEARVRSAIDDREYSVELGSAGEITSDSRFAVVRIVPAKEIVRQAKKDKSKPDDMPKDGLAIINLDGGERTDLERVKGYTVPEEGGPILVVHYEKPVEEKKADDAEGEAAPAEPEAEPAPAPEAQPEPTPEPEPEPEPAPEAEDEKKDDEKKKERKPGTRLEVRNLDTGEVWSFDNAADYAVSKDGRRVAYSAVTKEGETDGVFLIDTANGVVATALAGKFDAKSLTFSEDGDRFAFLANLVEYDADEPAFDLYAWSDGDGAAAKIAGAGSDGLADGWIVSEHGRVSLSDSGARLYFGAAPRPEPEPETDLLDDEKVVVDIWHYRDPYIQPMQKEQAKDERERSYLAVAHLDDGARLVQLAREDMPDVAVGDEGDADVALGTSSLEHRRMLSFDVQLPTDAWLVDPATGDRAQVLDDVRTGGFGPGVRLSPGATFAYWFDLEAGDWFAMHTGTKKIVNLTERIGVPIIDELHDTPDMPGPYGAAGWTTDDSAFLVYDRYDIWAVDPTGFWGPRTITDGVGRAESIRFRVVDLDPDEEAIPADEPLLLSAFGDFTKDDGFYRDTVTGDGKPERLIMAPKRFGRPDKADDADAILLTREDYIEFPDLHVTDLDFDGFTRISHANPQQDDYRWGTAELVEWFSADGEKLQGILYKPENFSKTKQYPMMSYFYERSSDGLHQHRAPEPYRSIINITFYVSRGYVVFVPDIPYKDGFPGDSAMNAIVPGVLHILSQGYVDPARLGLQGHSWGGYQIAYMVTQTDMFAAAEAGAPVSNMTSAYGGIRWGSGMSRQFQYEKTQSRIGGTLWDAQQRYIANSPVFWADRVTTPLLMMHNDEDGAVPWEQGIEMFMALRRLDKPTWLINYNGEDHNLVKRQNRVDWAIRMQQFFDHYLKDAPAPRWMTEGVPAVEKGRNLGLEYPEDERSGSE
jgi:dipeptidyl aminopeptidase/acylaminoacyl peptidase